MPYPLYEYNNNYYCCYYYCCCCCCHYYHHSYSYYSYYCCYYYCPPVYALAVPFVPDRLRCQVLGRA